MVSCVTSHVQPIQLIALTLYGVACQVVTVQNSMPVWRLTRVY